MRRALFCGALPALAVGFAAHAQTPESQPVNPPPSATSPPATDTSAATSMYKPGMTVKDSAGDTIGKITRVGRTADGTAAVAVDMDGKTVNLAASTLSLNARGDEAVSTMTKAEIKAAAPPAG